MPPKEGRGYTLRKTVAVPGIRGKRGRTFGPGQEADLEEYVNDYNAAQDEDATDEKPGEPIDLDATLARPGVVALDEDASQDELDASLSGLRNLTMAAPERSARWTQRVAKPEGEAADDDEDGPASRPARRGATKVAGAKRVRSKK